VHGEETAGQSGTVEEIDGDRGHVKREDGAEWKGGETGADGLKEGNTVHVTGRLTGDDTRTAAQVITGTGENDGPGIPPGRGRGVRRHEDPAGDGKAS
jgi:hypothetical protein